MRGPESVSVLQTGGIDGDWASIVFPKGEGVVLVSPCHATDKSKVGRDVMIAGI